MIYLRLFFLFGVAAFPEDFLRFRDALVSSSTRPRSLSAKKCNERFENHTKQEFIFHNIILQIIIKHAKRYFESFLWCRGSRVPGARNVITNYKLII